MAGWSRPPADPIEPSQPSIEDDRPGPAVFDVAPLGRRRRLPDRAVVVALIAVVVVGLAVAKPWETSPVGAGDPDAPNAAAASPGDRAAPAPGASDAAEPGDAGPRPAVAPIRWPSWGEIVDQVLPRDDWGARILTDASAATEGEPVRLADDALLVSEWVRAIPNAVVRVGGTGPVRLLGITTPLDEPILDLRVWRPIRSTAEPERVMTARLPGDRGLGEWLLLPPDDDPEWGAAWTPGPYRFELLLADRIAYLDVVVPGPKISHATAGWLAEAQLLLVGSPDEAPGRAPDGPEAAPEPAPDPAAAPVPVAVVGSVPEAVPARLVAPLDEHAAWLAAVAGERPSRPPDVAVLTIPDVAALGVAVPPGTDLDELAAVRLGGVPGLIATRRIVDPDGGRVIVLQPEGAAGWLPGVYRIDVAWRDAAGRGAAAAFHVDLEPGPLSATPGLLAAARGWARHAGSEGIVTGTVEPLEGGPAAAAIRLRPQVPGSAPETVEALGGGCAGGGVLADTVQPVLGVAHRMDVPVDAVAVERLFERGRVLRVPVRAAIDAVSGLVVLTPTDRSGWSEGWYRILLRGEGTELRHVVCLGPGPGTRAEVPPEAGTRRAWAALAGRRR